MMTSTPSKCHHCFSASQGSSGMKRAASPSRVLPYNSYSLNFGSVLADAYFVGKTLYPDRFADIDPAAMADEIYSFLVGEPVFHRMNEGLGGQAFSKNCSPCGP